MASVPKINVVIRKRPLSKKELGNNDMDIAECQGRELIVRELKQKVDLTKYIEEHAFVFDGVFDQHCDNFYIYEKTVKPLIDFAFQGGKVSCFAYGQTGSGKTYTMIGDYNDGKQVNGLYVLASQDVFSKLAQPKFSQLRVFVSFYEIYCGKLFDLLNKRAKLEAREDARQNVNIINLKEFEIASVDDLVQKINFGQSHRVTGVTGANLDSSRSHAILQLNIVDADGGVFGKISFIDLAGNERGADTYDQDKQTRIDGAEINKSLLALKECIRALDLDQKHTPFRQSKLTIVLKDSFVGNCKTVMIGNISPSLSCCEHTLNTLRYADRVKELKKPGNAKGAPRTKEDLLMLSRQQNNVTKFDTSGKVINEAYQTRAQNLQSASNNRKRSTKDQNAMINNFMEAKNRQKLGRGGVPTGQKQVAVLGKKMDLGTMSYNDLHEIHDKLINTILTEEEGLINSHRNHVDKMCEFSTSEYELLKEVEQPGSDIDLYVEKLVKILENKKNQILGLKKNLDDFKQHLQEEQLLSLHCQERQSEMDQYQSNEEDPIMDEMPRTDPGNREDNENFKPTY
jgi:kinesin family protein 2/24